MELDEEQFKAIDRMFNGCILVADTGVGKSRTAIAYYLTKVCDGTIRINGHGTYSRMKKPRDLYIITTAKKRDDREWLHECSNFLISPDRESSHSGTTVFVDSWNNIKKYRKVSGAFFIFDEQRVVGSGPWVKAFLDISRKNQWVLLSATPGDNWKDYIPVFVANGLYENRTDFLRQHAIYNRWAPYAKIEGFRDEGRLLYYRRKLLVRMKSKRVIDSTKKVVNVSYDRILYSTVWKDRKDPYNNCPIEETGTLFYLLRRVVNSDISRIKEVTKILTVHNKVIIFYNFDYELELLKKMCEEIAIPYSEWNGHRHNSILDGDRWVYLVNYAAGSEGWNCTTTDTIIFYSLNYSYRIMKQAAGRIDRRDTPFDHLFYFYLQSKSQIDIAINRALENKATFNETKFLIGN